MSGRRSTAATGAGSVLAPGWPSVAAGSSRPRRSGFGDGRPQPLAGGSECRCPFGHGQATDKDPARELLALPRHPGAPRQRRRRRGDGVQRPVPAGRGVRGPWAAAARPPADRRDPPSSPGRPVAGGCPGAQLPPRAGRRRGPSGGPTVHDPPERASAHRAPPRAGFPQRPQHGRVRHRSVSAGVPGPAVGCRPTRRRAPS